MLQVIVDLELQYIFVHLDEDVYSKLCHLLWKNPDLYQKIILLMGGFHQLRVLQKILYKRHLCHGYKEWCVDAKTIAEGSACQAWKGRYYYRSMKCHKECFDVLMQFQVQKVTNMHANMDSTLIPTDIIAEKAIFEFNEPYTQP